MLRDATIAFDLDGTLVDTAPDLIGSVNHVLAGHGLAPVADASLSPLVSHGAAEMLTAAFAAHRANMPRSEITRLYNDVYLPHYADNIAVRSRPFPGLIEALDRLQALGARLVVCTNKWEGLSRKLLGQLGLDRRFALIAGRDTFDVFKPHPDHLRHAVTLSGGSLNRAIMVGDSDTDIRTAKAASIPVVAVTFGYTDTPVAELSPDAVIDHYDQLVDQIEILLDRSSAGH
jgi:phosphoglycolate phosphatase